MPEYKDVTELERQIADVKRERWESDCENRGYIIGYVSALSLVEGIIATLPKADVAEVKHGHWVKEKPDVLVHWHCSACKECYFLEEPKAKYCPHCGAKMDGG